MNFGACMQTYKHYKNFYLYGSLVYKIISDISQTFKNIKTSIMHI